jgi:RimJ/RimL family protein N-acetyltransferase
VLPREAFSDQPTLAGSSERLEPRTEAVAEDYVRALADEEVTRQPRTPRPGERPGLAYHPARSPRSGQRAIHRITDGAFLGEAVLNDFDHHDASANYRVFRAGPGIFGRRYGTETTRLVRDYARDVVGLHRLSRIVFTSDERARRTYPRGGLPRRAAGATCCAATDGGTANW